MVAWGLAVETVTTVAAWRRIAHHYRSAGATIGLVPTMGALHDGHSALVRAALAAGDTVLVTSFVNPLQFTNAADLAHYPSTPQEDSDRLAALGVTALLRPTLEEMWPDFPDETPTIVRVRGVGDVLEGVERPGHFDGVATVVTKLLACTGPCRAYFGEKDFQQLTVVRQLVADLALDTTVVGVATVRDDDGLALSSRNVRLSPAGRSKALALSRSLRDAEALAAEGQSPTALRATLRAQLLAAGVEVAYWELVDPATLRPVDDEWRGPARALVAGIIDGVRLIDNSALVLRGNDARCH